MARAATRVAGEAGQKPRKTGAALQKLRPKDAPAKASPRAQRESERREAILTAALEQFSVSGFAATRLDDVARRAGVAKGTIYLYFRDKESLFQELVRVMVGPIIGALEAAPMADLPPRAVAET